jgi:hypothetical protein
VLVKNSGYRRHILCRVRLVKPLSQKPQTGYAYKNFYKVSGNIFGRSSQGGAKVAILTVEDGFGHFG